MHIIKDFALKRRYKIVQKLYKLFTNDQTRFNNNFKRFSKIFIGKYDAFKPFLGIFPFVTKTEDKTEATKNGTRIVISDYDVEENISHLMALARIALERGDTDRAEAILKIGLQISEDYQVFVALPYMYDILATIAISKRDLEEAEILLVSVIEKLIQLGYTEDDNQIVDFKLRLSRIYSDKKENDYAEIGFVNCLNIQQDKVEKGDSSSKTGMLYVNCMFWYGLHKISGGNYKDAKQLINQAYNYSKKIKGLSPYQEMVIQYTLGDLNYELGDYDIALFNIQNAVMLAKGIGSLDLSRCYCKLAEIYLKLKSYKNAQDTAVECMRLSTLFNDMQSLRDIQIVLDELDKEKLN